MKYKSVYKVPNGKLLKISLESDQKNNQIKNINITGDFFVYPEESIENIENELKKTSLNREILLEKINSLVKKYNIEFIGLNAESLAEGILMCLK